MSTSSSSGAQGSPDRALRRLFLTLFLRGRSARGLRKETAPRSVASKLALTLLLYFLVGAVALAFLRGPVFMLSLYLHGMTLLFCGMFIAGSAGETLFNKEEADILLHRPVTPQSLLRTKLTVLVQVSLWISGSFNFIGLFAGLATSNGTVLFPVAHAISTVLEAMFCTGCVVLGYELCLRSFGRERLESVMTTVQVLVAVGAVLAGQIVPRLINIGARHTSGGDAWWFILLPPTWFAGFDDALAGSGAGKMWLLAALGMTLTVTVVWLALGRMARHYETGMQVLGETAPSRPAQQTNRRLLASLVQSPPLSWCLRDSVSRASFLLVARYLFRDRDVKLRVYPGLAPMLVMPIVFLMPVGHHGDSGMGGFAVAFAGGYLGMLPLFALSLLQYSQQWQAGDVFRVAPIPGPAALCAGARQAVSCFLTLPLVLGIGALVLCLHHRIADLPLLLPGLIALPIFTLFPHLGGKAVPFSKAGEEARSARRGLDLMVVMLISVGLSLLAAFSWSGGWFRWLLISEVLFGAPIYALMRAALSSTRWKAIE